MAKLVALDSLDIKINLANKPFSPRLINWVEPYEISGFIKTCIYTEVDSNLKVGERVFIINGNYDSDLLIKADKYRKGRDGYKILMINKCKIVLDIDYTGVLPWVEDTIDNFIKVYPVSSDSEFRYVNKMITSEGGVIDSKFSIYQDNLIYTENNYVGFVGFGQNLGLAGSPGFFIKGGTGSWVNVTSDFTTNFSSFLGTYSSGASNERIKIMNRSFTYAGKEFKEDFIYKYDYENSEWVVDVTYFRPFISKSNFRDGNFKGIWNTGLFGRQDKKIEWKGVESTWNIGTLLNTVWQDGRINSVFTSNESYFADIDEFGLPFQKINPSNNRGFGYNYVVDSEIRKTSITNGNFFGTLLGTQSATFSVVENHIRSWTQSINVNALGGEFNYCRFESANVLNSDLKNSRLNNTKVLLTKSTNAHYTDSLFYGSKFNSDGIIKVLAFDEWTVNVDPSNTSTQTTTYKFYISEDNYNRLKFKDQIYIKGVLGGYDQLTDSSDVLNFFDKKFILNDYVYHTDDVSIGYGATKSGFNYTVTLNSAKENEYTISGLSSSVINPNQLPSIDVHVDTLVTLNSPIDATNAYIIDSDFRSGLFDTSDWNSGSLINHNYDTVIPNTSIIGDYYDMSITTLGDNKLTINMPPASIEDDLVKIGSIVYLNAIDHTDTLSVITRLPDTYKVYNIIPPRTLILEEVATGSSVIAGLTTSASFTTNLGINSIGNRYNFIHPVKVNNSNVKAGTFRRSYIKNSVIYNQGYNNRDQDFNNLPEVKSLLLSEMIFSNSNNSINSGIVIYSFFVNGDDKWKSGIFYNSSWIGQLFKNGIFKSSRWEGGIFENGLFYKSNAGGGTSVYSSTYYSEKITSFWKSGAITYPSNPNNRYSWIQGAFLAGNFYKSGWEDGAFLNGKFYLSDWFGGTFSNGIMGDISLSPTDTNFYNGVFNNGVVENANLFAKNTQYLSIPSSTSPMSIIWNNGVFKSGNFGSTFYNSTDNDEFSEAIWNDGTFNGGSFISNARWKNGIFNGGKFTSGYGWTMSSSTYSTDYSWENGTFNGGEFGVGSGNFNNDYQFYTYGNSTWFTGEFNGGKFRGRIWNNGVLTAGDFEGSGTISVISPLGTSCSNPDQFVQSFGETGSIIPHFPQFEPYAGYGPGNTVWYNNVLLEYNSPTFSAGPVPSLIYWAYATMSQYLKKYHGIWRNGVTTDTKDKFIVDKKIYTDVQRKYTEKKISKNANINNALWITGTFSHPSGKMLNSVWLDGKFAAGTFKASSFNPYVKRNTSTQSATQSTFNFDDETCYWLNGTLDSSDFFISKWYDGKLLIGTGIGMVWKNGVANYMNAINVFWENGTWRNGNWYGSSFILPGSGVVVDDYTKQILYRGMSWSGTGSCHVWNIFNEDTTDSNTMFSASASSTTSGVVVAPAPLPPPTPPPTP